MAPSLSPYHCDSVPSSPLQSIETLQYQTNENEKEIGFTNSITFHEITLDIDQAILLQKIL